MPRASPRTAGGLHALGVSRGDVVAWQRPNGPDVVALYRACWRLGAVAAPIHHQAGDAEAARLLARVDPTVFFAADDPLPEGPPAAPTGRSADVACVLWTAGSSGEPKGVLHTQRTLGYKAKVMVDVHGLTAADVVLMPAPLAHISGLLNGLLVPQAAGMRAVFMAKWDPEHALDLIEAEHITFMVGPPTFFIGLMAADGFSSERVASLRLISSGGAGVTPAFVDEATERLGAVVKRAYGSTEAPTVATAHADDPTERGRDTDGRATGEVQFRLGEGDELLVSGPELCAGYDDPEATKAAFIDGWFHTGDRATIDDEGWITITGRLKDVIIRGRRERLRRRRRGHPRGPPVGPPRRRRRRARRPPRRAGRRRGGGRRGLRPRRVPAVVRRAGRHQVHLARARDRGRPHPHPPRGKPDRDASGGW